MWWNNNARLAAEEQKAELTSAEEKDQHTNNSMSKSGSLTNALAQAEVVVAINLFIKLLYSLCEPSFRHQVTWNHPANMLHLIGRHWCQHVYVDAAADVVVVLLTRTTTATTTNNYVVICGCFLQITITRQRQYLMIPQSIRPCWPPGNAKCQIINCRWQGLLRHVSETI